jgi:hypothetical protein
MKKNVGSIDQIVRIVIGLAVMVVGYKYNTWWGLAGLIPIATAIFNFCPFYTLFGIKTCKKTTE